VEFSPPPGMINNGKPAPLGETCSSRQGDAWWAA
jgi:hypothetical protein